MKKIVVAIVLSIVFIGCKQEVKNIEVVEESMKIVDTSEYESFGDKISTDGLISTNEMMEKYNQMAVGDSLEITFQGKVNSICQTKGCWMKVDLGEPKTESFVKFKDYSFFVPMDADGVDAIVKGIAYKEETSVEELQHYAKDAGKSEEEITAITTPKVEYTFMADGVLLKKKG